MSRLPKLFLALLLGILLLASCAADGDAPGTESEGEPSVLRVAMPVPNGEPNIAWDAVSSTTNTQLRQILDPLIGTDPVTGEYVPGLAESWEATPDAQTWTIKLRQGVQFHGDYGEFTARDVVESFALTTSEGAQTSDAGRVRAILGETPDEVRSNIETPDDYTVVFHLLRPSVNFPFMLSGQVSTLLMHSAAQLDEVGVEGIRDPNVGPAGTGPWEYVGRELGVGMTYRAVQDHWRQTPDFDELQIKYLRETSTRLAGLLGGEYDMAVVDRDLFAQAEAAGMEVFSSSLPTNAFIFQIGNNVFPGHDCYEEGAPLTNPLVRQAINKAIDRENILSQLFPYGAVPMHNLGFTPNGEYWEERWSTEFDERYGFDPEAATSLLAEAGYPNGFPLVVAASSSNNVPEMGSVAEVIAQNLSAVGIDVTMKEREPGNPQDEIDGCEMGGEIFPIAASLRPTSQLLIDYRNPEIGSGSSMLVPSEEMGDAITALQSAVDPDERAALLELLGDLAYDLHAEIPLVMITGQMVANPDVASSYVWPGNTSGSFSNFENVKRTTS